MSTLVAVIGSAVFLAISYFIVGFILDRSSDADREEQEKEARTASHQTSLLATLINLQNITRNH